METINQIHENTTSPFDRRTTNGFAQEMDICIYVTSAINDCLLGLRIHIQIDVQSNQSTDIVGRAT
jgi:hypothetical protein